MTRPCPACDIAHSDDPLFCLALGAAMGNAYADIHDVTEQMCPSHRKDWIVAMLKVSKTMQEIEARDRCADDPVRPERCTRCGFPRTPETESDLCWMRALPGEKHAWPRLNESNATEETNG